MDKEFKDTDNPFRIVFVCAMWLTGFDVKSLATIYLDKPLKAHTLMQTIARANRVCDGKSNGLVVDYIGVVKALRQALADYTAEKGGKPGDDPAPDKSELIAKIMRTIADIDAYMSEHEFSLKSLVDADDFTKLALVAAGANAMCATDEIKKRFEIQARELFRIGEIDALSARDADAWYEGLEIPAVHNGYIQRVHFSNMWPRNCFGFHLNCSRPPFDDINMRKGLHHALNVQAVINTIFRGDYTRLGSYFTGFGAYTDESIRALPFCPEKAREYFAKAGYTIEGGDGILEKPDGTRLQVVVSSRIDPLYTNCMNILREEAARCGLDLRVDQVDDTVHYSRVMSKKYEAAIFSWGLI